MPSNALDFELSEEEFREALIAHKMSVWEKFLETLKANMLDVHVIERLRTR